jgi:hypothetical protein
MYGIAITIVLALLSIESYAQNRPITSQCDQVRAAIAQHGLQAARQHAMEHYGLTLAALRTIEQSCGIRDHDRRDKR